MKRLFTYRLLLPVLAPALIFVIAASVGTPRPNPGGEDRPRGGRELYRWACASCHGEDGTGEPSSKVAFETPLPDFSSCNFALREPDTDWLAIAHSGGPARGFAEMMPAFGEALTEAELQETLDYIRTFCDNPAWPRGDLNFPRPLLTEKAYPEDEAVYTATIDVENEGAVGNEFVYEQRFGARNQWEVVVPISFTERPEKGWTGGRLGDVAVGAKRAFYHNLDAGTIFSLTGEFILPTSDESKNVIFEPFASFGQLLPLGGFVHLQAGGEIPLQEGKNQEAFWRGALGKSFSLSQWGRTWSPMVEVLGVRELTAGAPTEWDLVPQLQVTLNKRQNIMASFGVRLPADGTDRDARLMMYFLWDWFDGGLTEGW